jgi:hypothetical protein
VKVGKVLRSDLTSVVPGKTYRGFRSWMILIRTAMIARISKTWM